MKKLRNLLIMSGFLSLAPTVVLAASDDSHSESPVLHFGLTFLMFGIVLLAGKIGNVVERYGQPAVIGELVAGIFLSALGYYGWSLVDQITASEVMAFVASIGSLLLLFSIGLESNIKDMRKTGLSSLIVALIGVIVPFTLGAYLLGPLLFEDADSNAKLFLGASLVATSVGITASVFKSMGILRTRASQTVIGAAVIDDVLGLIVLAVVSGLSAGASLSGGDIALIGLKSFGFLAGAIVLGGVLARPISKAFSAISSGIGMKLSVAMAFALIFGFLAEEFGLEPIIGAFAAGLLLDAVHFDFYADPAVVDDLRALEFEDVKDRQKVLRIINKHKHAHIEDLIGNLGLIFIPVFFVYTGMQIEFGSLLDPSLYVTALIISVFAVVAKLVAGFAAKGKLQEKLLVGMSMVPRGEVGLIFAATGKGLGVLNDELFSVIILVVVITTFIAPPFIKLLAQKTSNSAEADA